MCGVKKINKFVLRFDGRGLLEGPAEDGDIAQTGDRVLASFVLVADEAADHDRLIVVHDHRGFCRAFRGRDRTHFGFGDEGLDFLASFRRTVLPWLIWGVMRRVMPVSLNSNVRDVEYDTTRLRACLVPDAGRAAVRQ